MFKCVPALELHRPVAIQSLQILICPDRAFTNLSPKTRLGVGLGILAWGGAGLYLSDQAEDRYGLKPTEKDKAELEKYAPKVVAVDKPQGR
jgi:hypothetical protein